VKVNDLHTAELTALLAGRTQGYALINCAYDRNELDLNRISQVRAHASWFLNALVELLSALAARHERVRVFFVHGWNVVQPVCDLGMGLKLRGDRLAPASKAAAPTLSPGFFREVVLPFREAALTQGIEVALGRRYPAADKDNLMQMFRRASPRISRRRFALSPRCPCKEKLTPCNWNSASVCAGPGGSAIVLLMSFAKPWDVALRRRMHTIGICLLFFLPLHLSRWPLNSTAPPCLCIPLLSQDGSPYTFMTPSAE
jgi:hypothetical protein